jgi:hypothetical protein
MTKNTGSGHFQPSPTLHRGVTLPINGAALITGTKSFIEQALGGFCWWQRCQKNGRQKINQVKR